MKSSLLIDLAQVPEEGTLLEGELAESVFDLPADDARPLGPLAYRLHVQRFGSELLLTGRLSAPFEFTCVRTLHPFRQTITLENAAISLEIPPTDPVDVTEALREEILIEFPADPRCEDGDTPGKCEIDPRYLSVDKPGGNGVTTPPRAGGDDRWSALDTLIQDQKDSSEPH